MTDLTDLGIHRTPTYLQEEELKAAGWKPVAAHPCSPVWVSPGDGLLYPGPGFAHSMMLAAKNKV